MLNELNGWFLLQAHLDLIFPKEDAVVREILNVNTVSINDLCLLLYIYSIA